MSAMRQPLSGSDLAGLLAELRPEDLGPGSDFPAIAVTLADAEPGLADRLRSLPCPVIGVGDGRLAPACDLVLPDDALLPRIWENVTRAPIAAMTLVQHLRLSEGLDRSAGLWAESMAYATVQTGPEFRAWQQAGRVPPVVAENSAPLLMERSGEALHLVMNRPLGHNPIGVEMRDALCEAFDLAALDPAITRITLGSNGRAFSTGGEVGEFGTVSDPATAHWIRSIRLPARHLLPVADRFEVRIAGGAIGAGIEIAAFARRVVATREAWFQLPEIRYGLIPGAGGTISIPRRIGRQRAAELMLSARRVSASEALAMGLVDEIEPSA